MVYTECALDRVQVGAVGQAFNGLDLFPVGLHREHQAGTNRHALNDDGATAAHPVLAADVGSGQAALFTDDVRQGLARFHDHAIFA